MEPHERLELINTLLEDANQNIDVLNRAIKAQDMSQHTAHSTSPPPDYNVLQQEHHWWEEARQGLTEIHSALAHIEQSERQRGVRT